MYLKNFLYLFLIDPIRIPFGNDYVSYTQTEPGYGRCMLNAYLAAFNITADGKITHDLLQTINREAMAFSPDTQDGQYKSICNNYSVSLRYKFDARARELQYIPTYSVDFPGMTEFVNHWFINDENPVHLLSFGELGQADDATGFVIMRDKKRKDDLLWIDMKNNGNDQHKHYKKIPKSIEDIHTLLKDARYQCNIDSMSLVSEDKIKQVTKQKMQVILDGFDHDILRAESSDEKIYTIVKYVQRIAQLHPFIDGNIRTCYILLNKLLRDYDLGLTILINPNRFDCCEISHLVKMVKDGQNYFKQLQTHQEGILLLKAEELRDQNGLIECGPQPLVDIDDDALLSTFIRQVTGVIEPCQTSSSSCSSSFFSVAPVDKHALLGAKLQKIIATQTQFEPLKAGVDARNYGLVLRQACRLGAEDIINTILPFIGKLSIDINQASSNGNTALDWLDSSQCDPDTKSRLRGLLISFGALDKQKQEAHATIQIS